MSCARPKTIICDEIFDENCVPSEKDILEYALNIGINPTTEKHLLCIAKDGLMQPLPKGWKPCMVKETGNYYYFNSVTGESQWDHPLDGYYKNLVKKGRSEGYSSAGDEDSKTSVKEDLKSCEEAVDISENMYSSRSQELSRLNSQSVSQKQQFNMSDNFSLVKSKDISPDRQKTLNPIGRPPLPPKRGAAQAHQISPVRGGTTSPTFPRRRDVIDNSPSLNLRFNTSASETQQKSSPSPTRIDIDSMSLFGPSQHGTDILQKTVPSKGLKIRGGGSMFLKSNQKQSPSPTQDYQPSPVAHSKLDLLKEPESLESPVSESITQANDDDGDDYKKDDQLKSAAVKNDKIHYRVNDSLNENVQLKSILRESSPSNKLWDVDPCNMSNEEKMMLRNQELEDERRRSVRFADFEKKSLDLDIRFHIPESEETGSSNSLDNQEDDFDMNTDDEKMKDVKGNFNQDTTRAKLTKNTKKTVFSSEHTVKNKIIADHKEEEDNRATYISSGKESGDSMKEDFNILTDINLKSSNVKTITSIENMKYDNNNIRETVTNLGNKIDEEILNCSKINNNNISTTLNDNTTENFNIEKSLADCQRSEKVETSSSLQAYVNRGSVVKSALDYLMNGSPTTNAEMFKRPELKLSISDNNAFNVDQFYDRSPRGAQITSDSNEYLEKESENTKRKVGKLKHMPEVDLNKVFESVREVLINSSEHSEVEDEINNVEMNEISTALDNAKLVFDDNEDFLPRAQGLKDSEDEDSHDEVKTRERRGRKSKNSRLQFDALKRVKEMEEREIRIVEDEILKLKKEQEKKLSQIIKDASDTQSFQKQRILKEMQNEIERIRVEIEKEKEDKETKLRKDMEQQLEDYISQLDKEKEIKEKDIKEKHDQFLLEQEEKIKTERKKVEEETNARVQSSVHILAKFVEEMKEREEKEMLRIESESKDRIKEVKRKTEEMQAEHEEKHKQELAIVDAELERIYGERKTLLETVVAEQETVLQEELATAKEQHEAAIHKAQEQQQARFEQFWAQCQQEEEFMKKKHAEKMEELTSQLKTSEKEDINREFEKVRCEKRLLEDKYRTLKEKYVRLKSEVRLSMERKRQAKLNRQLQQRDASTTEETTERSTDHSKPPPVRLHVRKPLQIDEPITENGSTTPKTIKRRPPINKSPISVTTTSSLTGELCPSSSGLALETPVPVLSKPKNVWYPSPLQRREGVMDADISSADDNHTSVSEDITGCSLSDQDQSMTKWEKRKSTSKALSSNPIDSLRKQLEKLEELEEQFPPSTHIDTYLRYPFSGPGASSELEFYRHRLHLERESVRRAKQALAEQKMGLESRQIQLRHKQANSSLQQLQQEERELTDMEVSLHRTRSLLGEKIIRLRYLEQSLERATPPLTEHHSPTNTLSEPLGATDSSGFSGSDLDLSSTAVPAVGQRTERFWTDTSFNVLQSLENINSEIREIWAILGKQQIPGTGLGPPPLLQYSDMGRAAQANDISQHYHLAPRRATDIAERTRGLKEWLVQARDHHTTPPLKQVTL